MNFDNEETDETAEPSGDRRSESEYYGDPGRRAAVGDRRSARNVWLVSYADFMTILMIFFLAMYGYTYLAKTALASRAERLGTAVAFDEILDRMQDRLGESLSVEESERKTTLRFDDKILFVSGRADLQADAKRHLAELAGSIKLVQGDVIVEGHTDSVPVGKGKFRSNWELSAARAFSVIQTLTDAGVPAERLAAWGFGEHRPRADNATAEGRAQNRRIEIVILKKNAA